MARIRGYVRVTLFIDIEDNGIDAPVDQIVEEAIYHLPRELDYDIEGTTVQAEIEF